MVHEYDYDEKKALGMHHLQFDLAAEYLNREPWILEKIRHPRREFSVKFPLKYDDGHKELLSGYRVQHRVTMRTAAYMPGIGRVGEAKRLRGIFPQ
jgi:glutamate dehydrogenase/leucine dehydrogenase